MNFNSLVWYSSLAIGGEKNSYVADFLNRSCELINEEIDEEIKEKKLPINFNIDFLHIPKGEEGVGLLNNKLKNYVNLKLIPWIFTIIKKQLKNFERFDW